MALKPPPLTSQLDDFAWKEWFQSIYRELVSTGAVASYAPKGATYVTLSNEATLSSERVLTGGTGITLVDGGANSTITVNATTDAPVGASYVTLATNATLTSERVLTAGANITLTDNGAGNTLVVASTGGTGLTTVYDDPAYWMDA